MAHAGNRAGPCDRRIDRLRRFELSKAALELAASGGRAWLRLQPGVRRRVRLWVRRRVRVRMWVRLWVRLWVILRVILRVRL